MCVSVCVCASVSVCQRGYLRNHTSDLLPIFVHVAYDRGSVLLRCRCYTLCTSGFVDDIVFFFYDGPYSGMNFATKDRFRLNLLTYRKSDRIQFPIIKAYNFDSLFRYYSQTEVKKEQRNLTINGKNYRNVRRRSYGNDERWRSNKYTLMHGRRKAKLI